MTLDRFRPLADRVLDPMAGFADRIGMTPNTVSVIAFAVAVVAAGCFYVAPDQRWLYAAGGLLIGLNGWLDLLDGALAREQHTSSPAGDLLDHVLDRYADIVVLAGLAAGIDRFALGFAAVTGVLLTSYLGTQIEAVGLSRAYGGLLGRADRLALIGVVAFLAIPLAGPIYGLPVVGWLLVVFAIVGHVTAIQRFAGAWSDLQ